MAVFYGVLPAHGRRCQLFSHPLERDWHVAGRLLGLGAERRGKEHNEQPDLVEHISAIVAGRRAGLDEARAAAATLVLPGSTPRTLLGRIQRFLRLP